MSASAAARSAILILDDEPQVTVALADLFEEDFRVIPQTSAPAALETLRRERDIAAILCDQRMPGMTGDAFLARARELSQASRLLVTGYADLQAVIRAVNDGQIFGYISKPWDPDGIRIVVHRAVEHYDLRRQLDRERGLLRDLMRHSPDAIAFKDRQLRYVHLNQPEARILGVGEADGAIGRGVGEFLPPPRARARQRLERRLLRSGRNHLDRIEQAVGPDGGSRWYAANTAPIRNAHGEITGLVAITRDVTEQKWTEAGLSLLLDLASSVATADSFDDALRRTLGGICEAMGWEYGEVWEPDADRRRLTLGAIHHGEGEAVASLREAGRRHAVRPGEGPVGEAWQQRRPTLAAEIARARPKPPLLRAAERRFRAVLAAPIVADPATGAVDAVLAFYSSRPMVDRKRLPRLIGGVADEIGRVLVSKRTQERVRQGEQQFRALVEGSIQGILIHCGGEPAFANAALARIFGYARPDDILAMGSIWPLFAPEEHARLQAFSAARMDGREAPSRYEFRGLRRDGTPLWLECLATAARWRDRPAVLATIFDITERKQALEALSHSEAQLASAQRIAKLGSWTWVLDAGVMLSRESCRLLGRQDGGEIDIEAFLDHIHPEDRRRAESAFERACAGAEPLNLSCRVSRPDGEVRHVTIEAEVDRDGDGAPVRLTGTMHDVTEQRRLEEQLRQAQKMEAVGQLTGGVAHDFNNLLTVVLGNLQLMQRQAAADERMARWLRTAERAALRGADLTKRLLAFSRQQVLEERPIDVNAVVDELEEMFRRTLGASVELEAVLAPDLWIARIDRGELENALLNLVLNARDAMPGGGKLGIETRNVTLGEAEARGHVDLAAGDYVMLSVSDTGCGIPPEALERIFEPFFTTKEAGKGTGLGMSMVYGFIKQSNGTIEIRSELGRGTTVTVYLPRLLAAADAEAAAAPDEQAAEAGAATVLVVEDEDDLRDTLVGMLRHLGYRTVEAGDGLEALQRLRQHPEIEVLFTDFVMPGGMDGMELALRAREVRPGLKALLTSGYTRRAVLRRDTLGDDLDWIGKPYRTEDIARKLRDILG